LYVPGTDPSILCTLHLRKAKASPRRRSSVLRSTKKISTDHVPVAHLQSLLSLFVAITLPSTPPSVLLHPGRIASLAAEAKSLRHSPQPPHSTPSRSFVLCVGLSTCSEKSAVSLACRPQVCKSPQPVSFNFSSSTNLPHTAKRAGISSGADCQRPHFRSGHQPLSWHFSLYIPQSGRLFCLLLHLISSRL